MSQNLNKRIRSHNYFANPAIAHFIKNRRASIPDLTVFEWLISDSTQNSDENNNHSRCLTPVLSNRTDIECCICLSPAKNPFRCSKPDETESAADYNCKYTQKHHICCYQCITNLMCTCNSDIISCPMCRNNKFILDKLIPINDDFVSASQNFMVYCDNNCGLMGDPIALSHHICPLSDSTQIGHTVQSNVVHALHQEINGLKDQNQKMTKELSEVIQNYDLKKENEILWKSKYNALQAINNSHIKHISELSVSLEEKNSINIHLKDTIKEKDNEVLKLKKVCRDTIKRCKEKLKNVKKVYETKAEELRDQKDWLIEGIMKIGSNPLAFDTICSQVTENREKSLEITGKADNAKLINFSQISEATVFFKNTAYKLPPYDRESLSIIDLKKTIKKLIPGVDDNEYELCYFTYKRIDENEDSNRKTYSADKPKPLKTVVSSDNPNLIYLPRGLIDRNKESISIVISHRFVTDQPNLSSVSSVLVTEHEENSDKSVSK